MNFEQQLTEIWSDRHSGLYQCAYDRYLQTSIELALPLHSSMTDKHRRLHELELGEKSVFSFLLLEPAFLRGQLNFESSWKKMDELEKLFSGQSVLGDGELFLQKGLNFYAQTDFSQALDLFNLAFKKSSDLKISLLAQFNRILCLEILGYNFDHYFEEFSAAFEGLEEESWAASLKAQWQALQARQYFKKSDFASIERMVNDNDTSGQAAFYLAWAGLNPSLQLKNADEQRAILVESFLANGKQWLSDYMLRTLEGRLVNDDMSAEIKTADKIERLYLWVWRWLAEPDPTLLERIEMLIENVFQQLRDQELAFLSFQLLENALRWLALFTGQSLHGVQNLLAPARHPVGEVPPHIEYERILTDALFSARDGNQIIFRDTVDTLLNRNSMDADRYLLAQFVQSDFGGSAEGGEPLQKPLHQLASSLSEFTGEKSHIKTGFRINAFSGEIEQYKDYQPVQLMRSFSYVQLLSFFADRSYCFKQEVLEACFGIKYYDQELHDPKIANFLSRANRFFGESAQFYTRQEKIYCKIDNSTFERFGSNKHSRQILETKIASLLSLKNKMNSGHQLADANISDKERESAEARLSDKWMSRVGFSELLGVSKATANRRINEWIEKSWLIKRGNGKASMYKMLPPLEDHLKNSGEQQ